MPIALVWFRNDLRLADNPALRAALDGGYTPLPLYIHAPEEEFPWAPGAASLAWRHQSLAALDADLRQRGTHLRLFHGPSLAILQAVVAASGAEAVFWNRRYEPAIEQRDTGIKQALRAQGLRVESFNGSLMFEPWAVQTKQGGPFKVFTPFWRAASAQWRNEPLWEAPAALAEADTGPAGVPLAALGLLPTPRWDMPFWSDWTPGEAGAHAALEVFIDGALHGYADSRDRPDQVGTSRLSPHLHFGEIAPWRLAAAIQSARSAASAAGVDAWLRELGWREFAHHLLHHFPQSAQHNFNPAFDRFAWANLREETLERWRTGRTGVPIVDAGLRELLATGWMHNRVRMIVGSYLTKHMRAHWLEGARWFWDTLVDADLANNTLGWQWVAGTGADAAPYFRVFNPVTQATRFDPDARYITRWVPELAKLPTALRFAPWTDPAVAARLAPDYPAHPLVDLASGRDAALGAYRTLRASR
ncbi:deoxyribodipyrimidine photolyase [Lysobacter daejeonensis GH1-9]|uniref:Deoxyribodipyrimidine photolyase n=1 Tax=Lysobacter daejeonensis GH1-9 TaxID=1385517 RepID=A0A0A0EXK5_9GAMM|nr:deoxyribodipyrimidine photo-lyase [Lysobacter daejeonensis]KGM55000.1 deoxyribodipyrimidine photolyase [Lysobacter daejeonensis GH1-9]